MAEWSKALVLGTSHFGGAGSNPASVIIRSSQSKKVEHDPGRPYPAWKLPRSNRYQKSWVDNTTTSNRAVFCPNPLLDVTWLRSSDIQICLITRSTLFRVPSCIMVGWPSGLRRWFKAPVTSVARVRISLLSHIDHSHIDWSPFPRTGNKLPLYCNLDIL